MLYYIILYCIILQYNNILHRCFVSREVQNLPKMDPKMAPKSSQNGPQNGPKMPPSKRPLLTRPKHCKTAAGSPKMCNPRPRTESASL